MCQFRQSYNRFTLRGLCLDSKHDTVFFLERTLGAMPYFKGISSSIIRWNITRNTWVLNHLRYTAPAYLAEDSLVRILPYFMISKSPKFCGILLKIAQSFLIERMIWPRIFRIIFSATQPLAIILYRVFLLLKNVFSGCVCVKKCDLMSY